MTTFTWLHLSDLHFRGTETAVDRKLFHDMLSDISTCRAEEGMNPDVVFFTGDISSSGQKEQYDQVGKWLDEILDVCGLSGQRQRLFVVPGNHDVNRAPAIQHKYIQKDQEDFARALLKSDEYNEISDFFADDEHMKKVFGKLGNFAQFVDDFFLDRDTRIDPGKYYSVRIVERGEYKISVIGLNSVWLSFQDNEQGRLLVGEHQVCDALEEMRTKCPDARLRIALLHHPLYWLAEKDIHKIQQHLPRECDLVLRGHLHYPSLTIQSNPDSHLLEFAAGASLKAKYHAYNLVKLNLDSGEGIAIVRLQHPDIGGKWGADSFTYSNAKEGKIVFSIDRLTSAAKKEA